MDAGRQPARRAQPRAPAALPALGRVEDAGRRRRPRPTGRGCRPSPGRARARRVPAESSAQARAARRRSGRRRSRARCGHARAGVGRAPPAGAPYPSRTRIVPSRAPARTRMTARFPRPAITTGPSVDPLAIAQVQRHRARRRHDLEVALCAYRAAVPIRRRAPPPRSRSRPRGPRSRAGARRPPARRRGRPARAQRRRDPVHRRMVASGRTVSAIGDRPPKDGA